MARRANITPEKVAEIVADYIVTGSMPITAQNCHVSGSTVQKYVREAQLAGQLPEHRRLQARSPRLSKRPRTYEYQKPQADKRSEVKIKYEHSGFIQQLTPAQMMGRR